MILEKIISRIPNGLKYFGIIIVGLVILWLSVILYTGLPNPFYVAATPELLPNIQIGDLLLARGTDGGISIDSLRLGDVIIYHAPANYDRIVVSRIIQIQTDQGERTLKTQADSLPTTSIEGKPPIRKLDYIGKVVNIFPKVGLVIGLISPPVNYIIIIGVPLGIFVYYRKKKRKEE